MQTITQDITVQKIRQTVDLIHKSKCKTDPCSPSKSRNVALKIDDDLTIFIDPKRLTNGNLKLKGMLVFDLPVGRVENGGSCINCKSCESDCYARKAEVQYLLTRLFRHVNNFLLKNHKEGLYDLVYNQLQSTNKRIARIHSSGDFEDQEAIQFWSYIIEKFPSINFYAYTKADELNFIDLETLANFNLIRSTIEGKRNFGTEKYVDIMAKKYDGFVCPAIKNDNVKCGTGENPKNKYCQFCVKNSNVWFYQH